MSLHKEMLFSIITVCFNSSRTIRQTFDSVLSQSCKDYEYLVIDGASSDGTVDIIKEYEPKFEGRMRWISEKDDGIYDAMNKGIKMAQGEYINFMNSDDYFENEALHKVKEVINSNPGYGVYFGATRWVDNDGRELLVIRFHPNNLGQGSGYSLCHQGVFESRNLLNKYGGFSTRYKVLGDLHHIIKIRLDGATFCPLDFCIAGYSLCGVSSIKDISSEYNLIYDDLGIKKLDYATQRRRELTKKIDNIALAIIHWGLRCGFGGFKIIRSLFCCKR